MSSESSSIPSKNIAPDQKKNQKPSSFRFNANAQPFKPSTRDSSWKTAKPDGNHGENHIQKTTSSMGCLVINTSSGTMHGYYNNQPPLPTSSHFQDVGYQYMPQYFTSFGCAPPPHSEPQYHALSRPCTEFQPAVPIMYPPPPQSAMYVRPSGSVPYDGYGAHPQEMMNQPYSGPFPIIPSMNMPPPPQLPILAQPSGPAPCDGYSPYQQQLTNPHFSGTCSSSVNMPPQPQFRNVQPSVPVHQSARAAKYMVSPHPQQHQETRNPTVGRPLQNRELQGWQPSEEQANPDPGNCSRSNPQTNGAPSTQTVTEEMSNISKEQEKETLRVELERLRKLYSDVESWAKSVNIDLESVVADHKAAATSSKVRDNEVGKCEAVTVDDVVKPYKISETKMSKQPEASKPKGSSSKCSSEIAHEVVRPEEKRVMPTGKEILEKFINHRTETVPTIVRMHEFFQAVGIKVKQTNCEKAESSSTPEEVKSVDEVSKSVRDDNEANSSSAEATEEKSCEEAKEEKIIESVEEEAEEKQPANRKFDENSTADAQRDDRADSASPIRLDDTSRPETILNALEVSSPMAEPVIEIDSLRDECEEIVSAEESQESQYRKKTPIASTKASETITVEDKENVQPLAKKVPDYSKWVNRDEVHKKWAAENVPAIEVTDEFKKDNSPTETPIVKQQQTKANEDSTAEKKANQKSDVKFITNVHKKDQLSVEPVKKCPKKTEEALESTTSSESCSLIGPSEDTESLYESEEVKEEEEFKAQLRTQIIFDQCENIENWLFAKAKKELIKKKRDASTNSDLLDEDSLKDLVTEYVDLLYEYSDVMYLNRASYLAFDRKRPHVHRFQELMITHWRHNPLYAHRAKRDAAKIDAIVRGRMEHYKNLGTLDGQQMFCFLAVLVLMHRKCLTADLLFLYGSSKSDSCLSEHEKKYFDMVLSFRDWEPEEYRPKPAYSEDIERLPVELYVGDMVNFLRLLNYQCYLRIQQAEKDEEMDKVQALVYNAYMDSRVRDIECSPMHTTKFLRSRLTKLKKIKEPSEENIQHRTYYEFLMNVSSSVLDFDVYWFKQCLNPKNTDEWHCLKSDADFFQYLFTTFR